MNQFLKAATTKDTVTENGALAHSSTGNVLLDYFAQCSTFRGRSEQDVAADAARIFGEDKERALKIAFYNRMVTRKVNMTEDSTESVQKGQGNKDEFVKTLKWLENNHPEILEKNLWLVPYVGSYKDLWYDSASSGFYHYTNPKLVYQFIADQLEFDDESALIAKYLPRIRSRSNISKIKSIAAQERAKRKNNWARGLCEYLGISERQYRRFKSDPKNKAHIWQRQMSKRQWNDIDFNKVPGKALFNLVKGNVIEKHKLETKFEKWIKSQKVAKFTGYVYELFKQASQRNRKVYQKYTYDKQFETLLDNARNNIPEEILDKGVLCALDTSASMTWYEVAKGVQPYHICLGLGVYFASLIKGHFHNNVIAFSSTSQFVKLSGESFCEKVDQVQKICSGGGTNFQSVIDEIVRVRRQNPKIPIEDYPKVLLVCSDMQFNPTGGYSYAGYRTKDVNTNYEQAMRKLESVGLPRMTIIWWYLRPEPVGNYPSKMDDEGIIMISGFDPTVVTTLLEGQEKAEREGRKIDPVENMENCLDQELLNLVQV